MPAGFAQRPPAHRDTAGVLGGLSIASFTGTNQDSIQAAATDASGNIYVAGTTSSPQFPVKNAEQPVFGDSRILRTTNLGATWTASGNPPADVTVVVADPVSPQVLFSGGSNGIYKSTNAGQTWRVVYSFPVGYLGFSMVIDPGNHLRLAALTPPAGLIRSLDGGETWTPGGQCPVSACTGRLIADPTGSGALLVTFNLSISRDWGLTFQPLSPPGPGIPSTAAFDPSNPGWIYADVTGPSTATLSLSTDYGSTWTSKASPPSKDTGIVNLGVDPNQPNTLFAATLNALYKSTDGAAPWTLQAGSLGPQLGPSFFPDTLYPFVLVPHTCSPAGGLLAINSAVAFSPDFGVTWTTPQLTNLTSVAAGPGCTFYVTRTTSSDAFVAKIAPDGGVQWATYLGGSDIDAAVALVLDQQGNVYVAGNTSSPDFPTTVAHIGPQGENSAFITKFSPGGQVIYSATLGGEAANIAIALAVDAGQDAYIAGRTNSSQFPVTPGVIATSLEPGSYTAFLAKLSSDATLAYATYLGTSGTYPAAILVDTNEEAIVAGTGLVPGLSSSSGEEPGFVMKVNSAASQVVSATYLPVTPFMITGLAADAQNNLVILAEGSTNAPQATPGAYASPEPSACIEASLGPPRPNAFVMKLRASDWQPVYTAVFAAPCGIQTGAVSIDPNGSAVLAMAGGAGLPLRSPLLAGPVCAENSSVIVKLSADGSTLLFGTYLDTCGIPAIAAAGDGSIYAGVSPTQSGDTMSVLHLTNPNPASISLDRIWNSFSGDASAVAGGGLYTLTTSGFQPSAVNLGINPSQNLPLELSGVQVKFDGVPAAILSTAPGQIMVAVPQDLSIPDTRGGVEKSPGNASFLSVELIYNGVLSNKVLMPVRRSLPGLLTLDFPNLPSGFVDGNIRNQDGTLNDVNHPAALGSTITLFATGMGATNPVVATGSVAQSLAVSPVTHVYPTWLTGGPENVFSVPGFVSSMFQIQVPVPPYIQDLQGTSVGNGVTRASIGLLFAIVITRGNSTCVQRGWGIREVMRALFLVLTACLTAFAQLPQISPGGVVSAASWGSPVAPGEIVAIFGSNLAAAQQSASGTLPLTLGGTSVTINGVAAPLAFVSSGQINAQVPSSLAAMSLNITSATVVVATPAGSNARGPGTLALTAAYPGFFTADESGCGPAAALNIRTDGTVSINSPSNSAAPGDYIALFGTGFGLAVQQPRDGFASGGPVSLESTPSLFVDSNPVSTSYAGLAPTLPGVDQINFQIPASTRDGCAVPVSASQTWGSPSVTISIQSGRGQCTDPPIQSWGQLALYKSIISGQSSEAFTASFPSGPDVQPPAPEAIVFAPQYVANVPLTGPSVIILPNSAPLNFRTCPVPGYSSLSAGAIQIQPPSGSPETAQPLPLLTGGVSYSENLPIGFIAPGPYTISGSPGGSVDLTASLVVGSPIQLLTTFPAGTVISSSQPLTLKWTGGDPGTLVKLTLISGNTSDYTYADASSGSLTIPPLCIGNPFSAGGNGVVCSFGLPLSQSAQIEVQVMPSQASTVGVPGVTGPVQLTWQYSYDFFPVTLGQ